MDLSRDLLLLIDDFAFGTQSGDLQRPMGNGAGNM
jgi:hypothetical protein